MSRYRKKMGKRNSRKYFTKTASKTHYKNIPRLVKRGGYRL